MKPPNIPEKCMHANKAVRAYATSVGGNSDKMEPYDMIKLICDLLHVSEKWKFKSADIMAKAFAMYDSERLKDDKRGRA